MDSLREYYAWGHPCSRNITGCEPKPSDPEPGVFAAARHDESLASDAISGVRPESVSAVSRNYGYAIITSVAWPRILGLRE